MDFCSISVQTWNTLGLSQPSFDVSKLHNGYFSQDKKGRLKDTKGDTQADDDTYNTIMRDKEWLLSFASSWRYLSTLSMKNRDSTLMPRPM